MSVTRLPNDFFPSPTMPVVLSSHLVSVWKNNIQNAEKEKNKLWIYVKRVTHSKLNVSVYKSDVLGYLVRGVGYLCHKIVIQ